MRKEVWFEDLQRKEKIRMIILDALEVKIQRQTEDKERVDLEYKFEWDVIDYTTDLLRL